MFIIIIMKIKERDSFISKSLNPILNKINEEDTVKILIFIYQWNKFNILLIL